MSIITHDNNNCNPPNQKILDDRSGTGRQRPWREHKMSNIALSNAYEAIDHDKAERLRNCATRLIYNIDPEGRKILSTANFCRVRLCPVCQWRRSLKTYLQLHKIISAIEADRHRYYAMLTLTIRNCYPADLKDTLDKLSKGINRLMGYTKVSQAVKGWYRGQEITHNTINNTYHPHYHILLCLNKSYPKSSNYITQAEWQALWRKAMRLDYDPQVDIRPIKGNNTSAVLAECAKYATKISEIIIPNDWVMTTETVALLDEVLSHRRFAAMGGIIKYWHRRLNLDDTEEGNLADLNTDDAIEAGVTQQEVYIWRTGYHQYISANPSDYI